MKKKMFTPGIGRFNAGEKFEFVPDQSTDTHEDGGLEYAQDTSTATYESKGSWVDKGNRRERRARKAQERRQLKREEKRRKL